MKLQYLGHSCFRIISELGTTVVCDPYSSDYVGFSMPKVRCDAVTVSHHHSDHDCCDSVLGSYTLIDEKLTFPADDIAIDCVSTYHDDVKGEKRGKNLVFKFVVDGLKVVHMGDVGCIDKAVIDFAKGCDVLLMPVGGVYTVDAKGAKRYVDEICPKIVVPMHYADNALKFSLNSVNDFTELFDKEQVQVKSTYAMELQDQPQNEKTQVVVLKRCED